MTALTQHHEGPTQAIHEGPTQAIHEGPTQGIHEGRPQGTHQEPARRAHPIYYAAARRDSSSPPSRVNVRDGLASFQLMLALDERGIAEPGEVQLNMPPSEAPQRLLDYDECLMVDLSDVLPGDYLALATRPPQDEYWQGAKKKVEPANTRIERVIFRNLREYLEICSRSHIRLSAPLRAMLPPELADRAEMFFFQREIGTYKVMNAGHGCRSADHLNRTAVFLLRLDALWKGGPGLVLAFGVDAVSTLVWTWHLRRSRASLLDAPGFAFFELIPGALPERPTNLRWAESWGVEPVLVTPPLG